MKKAFLSICAVFAAIILIAAFKQKDQPANTKKAEQPAIKTALKEEKTVLFVIKAYNDSIAIFKDGKDEPFKIIDEVVLKTLPKADQELLEKGIPIHSLDELIQLIEDYDS